MNKFVRYTLILGLFIILFAIRGFATTLFYDPLIEYFQNDYLHKMIPEINTWHLVIDLLFRYTLNTVVSLAIIQLILKKKEYVKFAGFFYMVAFMVLIIVFVFLLRNRFQTGYLLPFYIRRFIIHPIFLLILLPTFYYQQLNKK